MPDPANSSGKPFDVSLKNLIGSDPKDWRSLFDLPLDVPIVALDSDLASMSFAADRLYKVGTGKTEYGLHAELESGHTGASLPRRLLEYSIFAEAKHKLLFRSIAVLLTRGANSPSITGRLERRLPNGMLVHAFHYDVIRIYEIPAEELLASGLSVVPLAPLGSLPDSELPRIVERMGKRFKEESGNRDELRKLWSATWLLMSARHSPQIAESLLKGAVEAVLKLEDFPLYDYLKDKGLQEGRAEGMANASLSLRATILRTGKKRYGEPTTEVHSAVAGADYNQLQLFVERLPEAESWEELLTM